MAISWNIHRQQATPSHSGCFLELCWKHVRRPKSWLFLFDCPMCLIHLASMVELASDVTHACNIHLGVSGEGKLDMYFPPVTGPSGC